MVPAEGGKPVDVLGTWQYEPGNITWWKDGTIRMETSTGGSSGLWQVNPATKTVSPILSGRRQVQNVRRQLGAAELRLEAVVQLPQTLDRHPDALGERVDHARHAHARSPHP